MGRGLAGPVCRPGIRMVSCWRNEVCKIRRTSVQGSPRTQGVDARPGAELAQSSVSQGPWPCSPSFCSGSPHCPSRPFPLLPYPDRPLHCMLLPGAGPSPTSSLSSPCIWRSLSLCLALVWKAWHPGFQALSPAWQNPLALAVGGGWEFGVFLSLAAEGKLRLRMQAVP